MFPPVTAKTQLNGGEIKTINLFFDSGSQQNFKQEEIATKLKLKIVQDGVTITVNGFTGIQNSLTCTRIV